MGHSVLTDLVVHIGRCWKCYLYKSMGKRSEINSFLCLNSNSIFWSISQYSFKEDVYNWGLKTYGNTEINRKKNSIVWEILGPGHPLNWHGAPTAGRTGPKMNYGLLNVKDSLVFPLCNEFQEVLEEEMVKVHKVTKICMNEAKYYFRYVSDEGTTS